MMIEVVDNKMGERTRILIFVRYYLPGYKSGGPMRTIANLVEHLGGDFDFHIITSDRDALDTKPYEGIIVNEWNQVGKTKVFYVSPSRFKLREFATLINSTTHDIIYLNSFFDPVFTMLPLLTRYFRMIPSKPIVLAPRGEFSKGALELKPWKKKPYLWVAKLFNIYNNITWQASSDYEAQEIRAAIGKLVSNIQVAPNLAPPLDTELCSEMCSKKKDNFLKVVFLSRVTPKKNLIYALEVISQLSIPIQFDIFGPVRDEKYWQECRKLIEIMPENITVKYQGSICPDQVLQIMQDSDLFFLPTKGENYGHVIAEALAAGTPVLIADTTPWRDLEQAGVGWDLPLTSQEKFINCIEYCANLGQEEYNRWRKQVQVYAAEKLYDKKNVEANLNLFINAMKRNS